MSTLFAGRPACDPASLYRECQDRGLPAPWWGKANSFAYGLGREHGTGSILLRKRDLDAIPQTTDHALTFLDDADNQVAFQKITLVKAECASPGWEDDLAAPFLCEVVDRRWHLARVPVDRAFNVSDCVGEGYLAETLDSGGVWTWQGIVNHLTGLLGLSALTLPFTPSGTPENLTYWGSFAWFALCDVLDRAACGMRYDPVTDTFSVVRLGTASTTAEATLDALDGTRTWDSYAVEPARGWRPEKVRVRFRRFPLPDDGSSPWYTVDVTLEAAAGVVAGSVVQLDDDLTARAATGVPLNAVSLASRANERASDWVRKRLGYDRRLLRVFRDFDPDVPGRVLSSAVGRVGLDDRGGPMRTEVRAAPDGSLEDWQALRGLPVPLPEGCDDCCGWIADPYTAWTVPALVGVGASAEEAWGGSSNPTGGPISHNNPIVPGLNPVAFFVGNPVTANSPQVFGAASGPSVFFLTFPAESPRGSWEISAGIQVELVSVPFHPERSYLPGPGGGNIFDPNTPTPPLNVSVTAQLWDFGTNSPLGPRKPVTAGQYGDSCGIFPLGGISGLFSTPNQQMGWWAPRSLGDAYTGPENGGQGVTSDSYSGTYSMFDWSRPITDQTDIMTLPTGAAGSGHVPDWQGSAAWNLFLGDGYRGGVGPIGPIGIRVEVRRSLPHFIELPLPGSSGSAPVWDVNGLWRGTVYVKGLGVGGTWLIARKVCCATYPTRPTAADPMPVPPPPVDPPQPIDPPPPVDPPPATFTVSPEGDPPPGRYPVGTAVDFTANPDGVVGSPTYHWYGWDGAPSVDENPTHTFAEPGVYTILLHAENGDGPPATTADGRLVDYVIVANPAKSVSADYEVDADPDDVPGAVELVLVDATGGARTVTLPDAVRWFEREITVKKSDASGNQVLTAPQPGQTIDGSGLASHATTTQNGSKTFWSDGFNWHLRD